MLGLTTLRIEGLGNSALILMVSCLPAVCLGAPAGDVTQMLPLSVGRSPVPAETTVKTAYSTIEWEGTEYGAAEGTQLLMRVILNPATGSKERATALDALSRLRNTDTTLRLESLYPDLHDREEKLGVVLCLAWSKDPRGLPLLIRIVDHERDNVLRFYAAMALAQWNMRRGVRELISLFDCNDRLNDDKIVGEEAMSMFQRLSRPKQWGFPEDAIRKTIEQTSDISREDAIALYAQAIKTWFSENEHRFPDWKPGDPLPKVEIPKTSGG